MRLTQRSDYALRMLIHAALRAPAMITVGEVAQAFDLPAMHLNKVAQMLAGHGYLQTVRGRYGGLRLLHPPERVRLGDLVRVTEPDFQIAPCLPPGYGKCTIYDECILRGALSQATDAFLAALNEWTLADIVKRRKPLLSLIELAASS